MQPEWSLLDEPLRAKIMDSGAVTQATVIVAPIAELRARAAQSVLIEPSAQNPGHYSRDLWTGILGSVDSFALDERLFDLLEVRAIPFEVIYSSTAFDAFLPTDRTYVHHNLRGPYYSLPTPDAVQEVLDLPGAEYQTVILSGNMMTAAKAHRHLGGSRSATFDQLRAMSIEGRQPDPATGDHRIPGPAGPEVPETVTSAGRVAASADYRCQ